MTVITLEQVKAQLGLSDTTYDAQITAKIPYIDSTVKMITRNNYNYLIAGDMTLDSNIVSVYSLLPSDEYDYPNFSGINNQFIKADVSKVLEVGQQITGDNIPDGTYITNITSNGGSIEISNVEYNVVYIELSGNATASETGVLLTLGINIAFHPIIAKGIWYQIGNTSTDINDTAWTSRNVGPLSVSRSELDGKIDGKYGMPAWFVKAFPRFTRGF